MADNTIRVEGNYTAKWKSIHSAAFAPYYLKDLYKTYGRAFDVMDFLGMAGNAGLVPKDTVKLWEQNHWKSTITLASAITTGSASADISFTINAADYDGNGNPACRVGQSVLIPQSYQPAAINIPMPYQIVSRSGSAGGWTFTARPFVATAQISVEIPIGTELSLSSIQYARGMGLPESTTQGYFERTFYSTILKEKLSFEGGFLSDVTWKPLEREGKLSGYYAPELYQTEFMLDDQLNSYLFIGQLNGNAALAQTSTWTGSNKVLSGQGIWTLLDAQAQELNYTGNFENTDFVTVKNLLESQGIMDTELNFCMGTTLYDDMEQTSLDYIKEYSGGSDLVQGMSSVGFMPTQFKRNGLTVNLIKLKSFSNPFDLGNDVYELKTAGFITPTSKSQVSASADGRKKVMMNNMELRYLGNGVEDRTRVIAKLNGISGIKDVMPVTQYDGMDIGLLTEPMLIFTNVNQNVIVRKSA